MEIKKIPARHILNAIVHETDAWSFIDVRTEGEWEVAASPGFTNLPLLNNEERHLVGLCYKNKGSEAAIELGETLFEPHHEARLNAWIRASAGKRTVVCCWRGGMRSERVAKRLGEKGIKAQTVFGGFKALRNTYLDILENELPSFRILGGLTGVNKTGLLSACNTPKIDLEGLAHHRGSTFGAFLNSPQPAQVTFENNLAMQVFMLQDASHVLLEDESAHIGRNRLPVKVREGITNSPLIILEASMQDRVENIVREYIVNAHNQGHSLKEIEDFAQNNLTRIERRLGGKRKKEIESAVRHAFQQGTDASSHFQWIEQLLESYYDPMYIYGLERNKRSVLFKGDFPACKNWIETHNQEKPSG